MMMMTLRKILHENPTILAPLAGITNLPFRRIAKHGGAGIVCSEMISANGLVHQSKKTYQMLDTHPDEKPLSVQIFGSDPAILSEAAKIIEDSGSADILDINFGCSVKKVLKTGSGAALMKMPAKTEAILTAVRSAIRIPLTIKIRSGWDVSGKDAILISRIAENCGVEAVAVHPRTASQGFSGKADWSVIAAVKKAVSIPVIGNGDIVVPEDALRMFASTGCDAVMVGRAAVGKPWIFSQIMALLNNNEPIREDIFLCFDTMRQYLKASVEYFGEERACLMMRSRLGWFVKGLPKNAGFRESLRQLSSYQEAMQRINSYFDMADLSMEKLSSEF